MLNVIGKATSKSAGAGKACPTGRKTGYQMDCTARKDAAVKQYDSVQQKLSARNTPKGKKT
jgi:hypothetical protein